MVAVLPIWSSADPPRPRDEECRKATGDFEVVDGAPRYPAPPSSWTWPRARSRRLTRGPCHITALCWSPDGRRLAFAHQPHPSADQMAAAGCRWSPPGQDAGAAAGPGAFTSLAWSSTGWAGWPASGHGLAGVSVQLRSVNPAGQAPGPRSEDLGGRGQSGLGAGHSKSLPAGGSGHSFIHLFRVRPSGQGGTTSRGAFRRSMVPQHRGGAGSPFLRCGRGPPARGYTSELGGLSSLRLTRQHPSCRHRLARRGFRCAGRARRHPGRGAADAAGREPAGASRCFRCWSASTEARPGCSPTPSTAPSATAPHQVFAGLLTRCCCPIRGQRPASGNACRCANGRDWGGGLL